MREETDSFEVEVGIIVTVIVLVLAYALCLGIVGAFTHNACLERGYSSSAVAWDLDQYCITRVDQTDIVVPLRSLR